MLHTILKLEKGDIIGFEALKDEKIYQQTMLTTSEHAILLSFNPFNIGSDAFEKLIKMLDQMKIQKNNILKRILFSNYNLAEKFKIQYRENLTQAFIKTSTYEKFIKNQIEVKAQEIYLKTLSRKSLLHVPIEDFKKINFKLKNSNELNFNSNTNTLNYLSNNNFHNNLNIDDFNFETLKLNNDNIMKKRNRNNSNINIKSYTQRSYNSSNSNSRSKERNKLNKESENIQNSHIAESYGDMKQSRVNYTSYKVKRKNLITQSTSSKNINKTHSKFTEKENNNAFCKIENKQIQSKERNKKNSNEKLISKDINIVENYYGGANPKESIQKIKEHLFEEILKYELIKDRYEDDPNNYYDYKVNEQIRNSLDKEVRKIETEKFDLERKLKNLNKVYIYRNRNPISDNKEYINEKKEEKLNSQIEINKKSKIVLKKSLNNCKNLDEKRKCNNDISKNINFFNVLNVNEEVNPLSKNTKSLASFYKSFNNNCSNNEIENKTNNKNWNIKIKNNQKKEIQELSNIDSKIKHSKTREMQSLIINKEKGVLTKFHNKPLNFDCLINDKDILNNNKSTVFLKTISDKNNDEEDEIGKKNRNSNDNVNNFNTGRNNESIIEIKSKLLRENSIIAPESRSSSVFILGNDKQDVSSLSFKKNLAFINEINKNSNILLKKDPKIFSYDNTSHLNNFKYDKFLKEKIELFKFLIKNKKLNINLKKDKIECRNVFIQDDLNNFRSFLSHDKYKPKDDFTSKILNETKHFSNSKKNVYNFNTGSFTLPLCSKLGGKV